MSLIRITFTKHISYFAKLAAKFIYAPTKGIKYTYKFLVQSNNITSEKLEIRYIFPLYKFKLLVIIYLKTP